MRLLPKKVKEIKKDHRSLLGLLEIEEKNKEEKNIGKEELLAL